MIHWKDHFQNYDFFMNSFSAYRKTLIFHHIELEDKHYILDDGCGTGNLTLHLLTDKHKVSAIDPDPDSIAKTRTKCASYFHKNLDIQQMDGQNLKFDNNTFDGISSMFVIPFAEDTAKYISEMYRVTKPGGKIVITAWPPNADRSEYIVNAMESEFLKTGLLPSHQTEWNDFLATSKINTEYVSSSKNTLILPSALKDAGFAKIKIHEQTPYENHALFITCNKPR
jgi:ubiquinone/menaquinone biosynthesis C-methylase UbiE